MTRSSLAIFLLALTVGCAGASDTAGKNAVATATEDAADEGASPMRELNETAGENAIDTAADPWLGRWTGVEGMYLDVAATDEPGRYSLEMQYDLDNSGTFEGRRDGDAIAFERGGETLRLTRTDGEATGLRYLFGKEQCVTVASGEGYCRD